MPATKVMTHVKCARCKQDTQLNDLHTFMCRSCEVKAPMCHACWRTAFYDHRGMCYECKGSQSEFVI